MNICATSSSICCRNNLKVENYSNLHQGLFEISIMLSTSSHPFILLCGILCQNTKLQKTIDAFLHKLELKSAGSVLQ